jgi:proteic killer suppression protein
VIRSFEDAETQTVFLTGRSRKYPAIARIAERKLDVLDNARYLDDLRSPAGNRLEALKGNRAGQYSIRINDQYRLCFYWKNGEPWDVEIVDYH